jgi:hypothetical protein
MVVFKLDSVTLCSGDDVMTAMGIQNVSFSSVY